MVKEIFKFIQEKFLTMPPKVQIFTYLTMLALFIYLVTLPSFIDMKLVSVKNGEEFPVRDAEIQVEVSGRAIRILTDENGRFSVPMSTSLPTNKILFVLRPNPESGSIKEVAVPVTNSYVSRSKLIFDKDTTSYQIEPYGITSPIRQIFASIGLIGFAYASDERTEIPYLTAKETVLAIISELNDNHIEITGNENLHSDLKLDNIDLSYLNSKLNSKFDIDAWQTLKSSDTTILKLIDSITDQQPMSISGSQQTNSSRIERRHISVSFDEKNTHCRSPRSIAIEVTADTGWKIDVTTIKPTVNVSIASSFSGITNLSDSGFIVAGKVRNNGKCIELFGNRFAKDARGHIWGNVTYEVFREVTN